MRILIILLVLCWAFDICDLVWTKRNWNTLSDKQKKIRYGNAAFLQIVWLLSVILYNIGDLIGG